MSPGVSTVVCLTGGGKVSPIKLQGVQTGTAWHLCKTGSGHCVILVCRVLLSFPAKCWMQMRRQWRALGRAHLALCLRSLEGVRAAVAGGEPLPRQAGLSVFFHQRRRTWLPRARTKVMSGRRYETCHMIASSRWWARRVHSSHLSSLRVRGYRPGEGRWSHLPSWAVTAATYYGDVIKISPAGWFA